MHPNSFDFMQFSGNFGKFVCWRPPGSWRPLLGEILDPGNYKLQPNNLLSFSFCFFLRRDKINLRFVLTERPQSFSSDSWSDLHISPDERSNEITNAELGLAEDHFSQPEVAYECMKI